MMYIKFGQNIKNRLIYEWYYDRYWVIITQISLKLFECLIEIE